MQILRHQTADIEMDEGETGADLRPEIQDPEHRPELRAQDY